MEYACALAVQVGVFIILAGSFNLIIGQAGLASIAHPIFFALGAYASALLALHAGWPVLPALVAGAALAGVASLALSIPALRISGDYLMISSIGFQLGLLQVIKNLELTGGQGGLSNIPAALGGPWRSPIYAALTLSVALLSVLALRWLSRGPFGAAIVAMRDDEVAFVALGRNARRIKVSVFFAAHSLGSPVACTPSTFSTSARISSRSCSPAHCSPWLWWAAWVPPGDRCSVRWY